MDRLHIDFFSHISFLFTKRSLVLANEGSSTIYHSFLRRGFAPQLSRLLSRAVLAGQLKRCNAPAVNLHD